MTTAAEQGYNTDENLLNIRTYNTKKSPYPVI
jgi:hypothetical protein